MKVARVEISEVYKEVETFHMRADKVEAEVKYLKEVLEKIEAVQVMVEMMKMVAEAAKTVAEAVQGKVKIVQKKIEVKLKKIETGQRKRGIERSMRSLPTPIN